MLSQDPEHWSWEVNVDRDRYAIEPVAVGGGMTIGRVHPPFNQWKGMNVAQPTCMGRDHAELSCDGDRLVYKHATDRGKSWVYRAGTHAVETVTKKGHTTYLDDNDTLLIPAYKIGNTTKAFVLRFNTGGGEEEEEAPETPEALLERLMVENQQLRDDLARLRGQSSGTTESLSGGADVLSQTKSAAQSPKQSSPAQSPAQSPKQSEAQSPKQSEEAQSPAQSPKQSAQSPKQSEAQSPKQSPAQSPKEARSEAQSPESKVQSPKSETPKSETPKPETPESAPKSPKSDAAQSKDAQSGSKAQADAESNAAQSDDAQSGSKVQSPMVRSDVQSPSAKSEPKDDGAAKSSFELSPEAKDDDDRTAVMAGADSYDHEEDAKYLVPAVMYEPTFADVCRTPIKLPLGEVVVFGRNHQALDRADLRYTSREHVELMWDGVNVYCTNLSPNGVKVKTNTRMESLQGVGDSRALLTGQGLLVPALEDSQCRIGYAQFQVV